jgi:hypothetical protein
MKGISVDHSIGEALFNHACRSQALGRLEQDRAGVSRKEKGDSYGEIQKHERRGEALANQSRYRWVEIAKRQRAARTPRRWRE